MRWSGVRFLTVQEVEEIHQKALAIGGGSGGLLHHHELEASVMGVQAGFGGEPVLKSLADIAAGYAYYITRDHPFIDGNKRTALMTALAFLDQNGYELELRHRKDWQNVMVAVAEGKISREELAQLFGSAMGTWGPLTWGSRRPPEPKKTPTRKRKRRII